MIKDYIFKMMKQQVTTVLGEGALLNGRRFEKSNRQEMIQVIYCLKHHGFTHSHNEGKVAVYTKEWKSQTHKYTDTVKIGVVGEHITFDSKQDSERYAWKVGDIDYSRPDQPMLTRRGWWTGD